MSRRLTQIALTVFAICGAPAYAAAADAPRPAAFAQCASCHSAEPGVTLFGPSLAGVVGRKAGELADYPYSPGLKASKITWTPASLDRWLTSPQRMVPGTRMPFGGIADPTSRKQLIDYLATLK